MKKYEFRNVVAETLLIPLYMRAKESRRPNDAILRDPLAEELIGHIEYDYSRFDGAKLSEIGCVVRGRYFDDAVRRFITGHEHPVVVNVGCGLDTRYQRIEKRGKARFYELDLPEVIALRRELIPEPADDTYIADSLLETGWMDRLRDEHPQSAFIFIIEGVLMYFHQEQVLGVLHELAERFGGGELWFDVCGTMMTRHRIKPDSLRGHKAQIRWGLSDGHEIEREEPRLRLIEQTIYQRFYRRRWGFVGGYLLGAFPGLCRKFSSMMGYRIVSDSI